MSYVSADSVSFSFPGRPPLFEDISFAIEKGQCLGISGPSGCGKSTLAQIVAGHLRAQKGRVVIDGREIVKPCRDVFLVHQDSDLFPWLTVEKQIAFAGRDPARWIKLTKLSGFEKFYPHQLSGGMKKRLSIARALAVNPKLLIFDESFNSLDFELRMELFKDLKEIWRDTHTTILLISHDPRDLEHMAQKELRLEKRR
jgi:ABC-type nitrate/sulfonate/bicarbonate transport system ATPase subunit